MCLVVLGFTAHSQGQRQQACCKTDRTIKALQVRFSASKADRNTSHSQARGRERSYSITVIATTISAHDYNIGN